MKAQNIPDVSSGHIERIENFDSKYIDGRRVDIWLPKNYSTDNKYAVVYMQDGQMLFDKKSTWNNESWEADAVASKLMSENKVEDFIIVGIWNGGFVRHATYFPQKPYENLTPQQQEFVTQELIKKGRAKDTFNPNSDNYLHFLVNELKPYIDKTYAVYTDRKHTFIAGSSMGGMISIYAICEYPEVFGGAACLSTHWTGIYSLENNPVPSVMYNYLKENLPDPKNHKIYFDCGNKTLDELYPDIQLQINKFMFEKGYTSENFMTKFFPGEEHSEKCWNKRLHIPFEFLLKK